MASPSSRAPSDLVGLLASRPVLEGHVRRRLLALPNVRVIENCAVQGLIADDERAAIKGVRVRIGDERRADHRRPISWSMPPGAARRARPGSRALAMPGPRKRRSRSGSATPRGSIAAGPTDLNGKLAVVVAGSGPNWRNGVILYQTEDRWIVSIGGYFGDHAPDDEQMFAAYAGSLPTSEIYDIVAHAEPLTDFVRYRYPANLRRRYERLTRFPTGYLVFGDALCSFNPVYGQGMTVAAQEAALLQRMPRCGRGRSGAALLRCRRQRAIDTPWDIAVGNDLRHPQVAGPAFAKSALHQLVYRQAAHGRAA